jgi:hypothetical protein
MRIMDCCAVDCIRDVGRDEMYICAGGKKEKGEISCNPDHHNGVELSLHYFPVQVRHLR